MVHDLPTNVHGAFHQARQRHKFVQEMGGIIFPAPFALELALLTTQHQPSIFQVRFTRRSSEPLEKFKLVTVQQQWEPAYKLDPWRGMANANA